MEPHSRIWGPLGGEWSGAVPAHHSRSRPWRFTRTPRLSSRQEKMRRTREGPAHPALHRL